MKKIPSMRKGREMQECKGFLIISRTEAKVSVEGGKGKASSNYQTSHPLTPPPLPKPPRLNGAVVFDVL